jgi:probable rRNA maturation factor
MISTKATCVLSRAEKKMEIDVQFAVDEGECPSSQDFHRWAAAALGERDDAEMSIRIVDVDESEQLNTTYRHKAGPTNVLSFPAVVPDEVHSPLLGDLVICAPVVRQQAKEQGKAEEAHYAHMVVHGVLHLLGYDHLSADDAEEMESLEKKILAGMGYDDPYAVPA